MRPDIEALRLGQYADLDCEIGAVEPEVRARAKALAVSALAPATNAKYRVCFAKFVQWCERMQLCPLPAADATVALFIADLSQRRKYWTCDGYLCAIRAAHRYAGLPSPTQGTTVHDIMWGLRREQGMAQESKRPLRTAQLLQILQLTRQDDNYVQAARDRALLTCGEASALRRSNLAEIDVEHLTFCGNAYYDIYLPRSKTDQFGKGRMLRVCAGKSPESDPVRAMQEWLTISGITSGAVFRKTTRYMTVGRNRLNKTSVTRIVQSYAARIGLDPADYGAHSLRSGFCVNAHEAGAEDSTIMLQSTHSSHKSFRRYLKHLDPAHENVTRIIGL